MGINPSEAQLTNLGKKLLELVPRGVGAFVLVHYADSLPLTEIWRGEDTHFGIAGDGKRLLGVCAKRQRSVLIHDAAKDILMQGIKVRTFSSALCVPILDEAGLFLGALLLLSEKIDTFTKEHRYALERSSRELAQALAAKRRTPDQETMEEQSAQVSFLFSRPFLIGLSCSLLFFAMWLVAPKPKPKESLRVAEVEPVRNEVQETSQAFLEKLRAKDYDSAWRAMSPDLRSRWSRSDFSQQMARWAEVEQHQEILEKRKISKLQRHLEHAQVTLLEVDLVADKGPWDWQLTKTGGGWAITKLKGPIDSPNPPKKS